MNATQIQLDFSLWMKATFESNAINVKKANE